MQNKVIIIAFTTEKEEGTEFSKWPNHITLVPYFFTSDLEKLQQQLIDLGSHTKIINYEIGPLDYFGYKKAKPVNRIVQNIDLTNLHKALLDIAQNHDATFDAKFCFPNFWPHITHNEETLPTEGTTAQIKEIYLVKNLHINPQEPLHKKLKIVINKIPLNS